MSHIEAAASSKVTFSGYSLRTSVNGNKRSEGRAEQNCKELRSLDRRMEWMLIRGGRRRYVV